MSERIRDLEAQLDRLFPDDTLLSSLTPIGRLFLVIADVVGYHAWVIEEKRAGVLAARLNAIPDDWMERPHSIPQLPWDLLDEESFDHTRP